MAVLEPPERDAEQEEFNRIFARMTDDLDVDPILVTEVVVTLPDIELITKFNATKRELYSRGELLNPNTETGRELSAIYHACLMAMHQRGLM